MIRGILASSVCVSVPLAPSAAVTFPKASKMGAQAPRPQTVFLVIYRVSRLLHVLQVRKQPWHAGDGLGRSLLQTLLLRNCFHLMLRQPCQQAFPDARGMQKH